MGESGKYQELLEGSSSFSRLLDDLFVDTDLGEEKGDRHRKDWCLPGLCQVGHPSRLGWPSIARGSPLFGKQHSLSSVVGWLNGILTKRIAIIC